MNTNEVKNNEIKEEIIDAVSKFIKENITAINKQYNNVVDKSSVDQLKFKTSKIYKNISISEYNEELTSVSVVILTANYFEREVLNFNAYNDNKVQIKRLSNKIKLFCTKDFRVVDAYILKIDKYTILHLHAPETGSNTPCGSADLVRYINSNMYLQPTCIVSFGVCYGIDWKKQNIGDTIIAEKIYPWSVGIKLDENGWHIKHDGYIIDIREHFSILYSNINDIILGQTNKEKNVPLRNAKLGNMLTGEAVLSNEEIKVEAIQKAFGFNILGGEMEGYGLAKECIYYLNTPCMIVKSICDWGACKNIEDDLCKHLNNGKKGNYKDQLQAYAAYCAYTVLKKFFYENLFGTESLIENIKNFLIDNYHQNETIQEEKLKAILKKYFLKNVQKRNSIHFENDIVEPIIKKLVIDDYFTKKKNEGITTYTFR